MAFPTVTARVPTADDSTGGAASAGDVAATSHDIELPATVAAGDLLMLFGRVAVAGTVAVTGGGWTIVQDSSDASDDVTFWAWRNTLAAGTEDGSLVTVTHGSGKMVAASYAIAGTAAPGTQAPQSSTVAIGTSTTPNPTACTPTGGAKDYLWLWFGAWSGEQTLSKTAPLNYTDQPDASTGTGGAVTANVQLKTATRALNAASEDAGACGTLSVAPAGWTAYLIGIHPAGAVAVTGTLARTQANQTSSASGTVVPPPVTGTLAETQANQTSTADGTVTVTPSIEVLFNAAGDLDLFTEEAVNVAGTTAAKSLEGGEGVFAQATGTDENNRRLFLLPATFQAVNYDVRARFRLVNGSAAVQTGLVARVAPNTGGGGRAPLGWTNVIFGVNGQSIHGVWQYDGTTLNSTNQTDPGNACYGAPVTSMVGDGTTLTVTTSAPHLLQAGDAIQVTSAGLGIDEQHLGGLTIVSPTVFRVASPADGTSTGHYRWIFLPTGAQVWLHISLRGTQITSRYWRDGMAEPSAGDTLRTITVTLPSSLGFGGQSLPSGTGRVGLVLAHGGAGGKVRFDRFQAINLDTPAVAVIQDDQRLTASGTSVVPPVTGTLARTQAGQTAAGSGAVTNPVTGTLARTQAGQTSTASGVEAFTGTLARTQANQTGSAAGGEAFTGTLARTQAGQTSTGSGTVAAPVSGTLARTQADQTSSASGTAGPLEPTGTLARTQADQTLTATGVETIPGTLTRAQAGQTATAAGTVLNPVTGTLTRAQANHTAAAAGKETIPGTLARTQASQTVVAAGVVAIPVTGTLARAQAPQTLDVVAFVGEFETPPDRSLTVKSSDRSLTVPGSDRSLTVAERRTLNIPVEPR